MTLEAAIRQAMLTNGIQALNLFRKRDGGFQANIGYLDKGPGKIVSHADPARALSLALVPRKAAASQFEDLLG